MPRSVYDRHIAALKQALMDADCYLPFNRRAISALTRNCKIICDAPGAENLRSGLDRPIGDNDNGCYLPKGGSVEYRFAEPAAIRGIRIVFDSDLNRATLPPEEAKLSRNMIHNRPRAWPDSYVPKTITRSYTIEAILPDGSAQTIADETNNYQRLRVYKAGTQAIAVRLTLRDTWGAEMCHLFAVDVV